MFHSDHNIKGTYCIVRHDGKIINLEMLVEGVGNWRYNYSPIKINGKWGLMNQKGELTVKPIYNQVKIVNEKYLLVNKGAIFHKGDSDSHYEGGKWGISDLQGKILLSPQYDKLELYPNEKITIVLKDSLWGLLDPETFKVILEPNYQEIAYVYNTGISKTSASLFLIKHENKYGFANSNGKVIVKPIFSHADAYPYKGFSRVTLDNEHGYLNSKGEIVWWSGKEKPLLNK